MYIVYIIYSHSANKSYVGYTSEMDRRLYEHNNSIEISFTKSYRPWTLIYSESFDDKKSAILKEKFFKSGVGRDLKKKIIAHYLSNL